MQCCFYTGVTSPHTAKTYMILQIRHRWVIRDRPDTERATSGNDLTRKRSLVSSTEHYCRFYLVIIEGNHVKTGNQVSRWSAMGRKTGKLCIFPSIASTRRELTERSLT